MSTHIERMKGEHAALKENIDKLNSFIHGSDIFGGLCDLERARMIKQSGFMESYAAILASRISAAEQ